MFYIAAMPAEATAASCWDVNSTTLSSIITLLQAKEDSTVQVEHLPSHSHHVARWSLLERMRWPCSTVRLQPAHDRIFHMSAFFCHWPPSVSEDVHCESVTCLHLLCFAVLAGGQHCYVQVWHMDLSWCTQPCQSLCICCCTALCSEDAGKSLYHRGALARDSCPSKCGRQATLHLHEQYCKPHAQPEAHLHPLSAVMIGMA